MTKILTGGCHCGAVRYEVTSEPRMQAICHCRDCQQLHGATSVSIFVVPRESLRVEGTLNYYERLGGSGKKARLGFCPTCGTRLIGMPDMAPELVTVSALSLDDPSIFQPQMNVYAASALHWDMIDRNLPTFDHMPPNPGGE